MDYGKVLSDFLPWVTLAGFVFMVIKFYYEKKKINDEKLREDKSKTIQETELKKDVETMKNDIKFLYERLSKWNELEILIREMAIEVKNMSENFKSHLEYHSKAGN